MDPLRRPLPLISKRVEFEDAEPDDLLPSLPKITHRIEFSERLSDDIDRNGRSASLSSQSDSLGSEESGNINSDARAGVQDEDQDMDLTGSSSIYEDDVEDDSHQPSAFSTDRIPKPPGEPGRPHSGGYNLPTALVGWSKSLYTKVNEFVKAEAQKHLNSRQSYKNQDQGKIADICTSAAKRYPVLSKYDNYWPVRDMLKLHLKYKAEKHNRQTRL